MDEEHFLMSIMAGIDEAEVMTLFFPMLRCALVVDTRHNAQSAPLVEALPQLGSMEERVAMLEKRRPQLGRIYGILGVPWIKTINCFVEVGIMERIEQRLLQAGVARNVVTSLCSAALHQLQVTQYKELVAMIKGVGYETVWQRESE